jgi:hypothetical protein
MSYTKQTWLSGVGGGTPVSAVRLQYIEDGLEAAASNIAVHGAIVSAATTTTLTNADFHKQIITGSTTHIIKMPTTGVIAGDDWVFPNQSSGTVALQSSTGSTIYTVGGGRTAVLRARVDTPTAGSDWTIISVQASETAQTYTAALRNASGIILAVNFQPSKTATTSSAGTLTLGIGSAQVQEIIGTTTHTVKLPTTGVIAGMHWIVPNNSTGAVAVQSSGANAVDSLAAGSIGIYYAKKDAPTAAADWRVI